SGRCIQRSFANGKDSYEKAFEHRFETGELTGRDTVSLQDTTKYYTADHRIVYGGGGIKPDVYVPYDTARFSTGLLTMIYGENLKALIWDYFIRTRNTQKYRNINDFDVRFNGENELTTKYIASLKTLQERKIATKLLSNPKNAAYFKLLIKAQLARFYFRENGFYSIATKDDNVVQKALQVLNGSNYSQIIHR
ncbi:MAG: hypothetical protein JSS96_10425, partial [Bacteroidetes bacterium]|nr:hypothetical protein [Bacteroidota bacterium]